MEDAPKNAGSPAGKRVKMPEERAAKLERHFVEYCIVASLVLAGAAGLIGFMLSRPDYQFVGAAYNIDDTCVYFSWIRQAADGYFFIRNLFTTDLQNPVQFNLFILLLGGVARVTHIAIPILYYAARLIAAGFLLSLIYKLYRLLAPGNLVVRCSAFYLAALGSGFGWMFWPQWADKNRGVLPVDTWQPEALTFQSIDISALFAVSLILIVGIVYLLVKAQQSGRMRFAVGAGLCAAVLANIHSYDILHVAGAWLLYLVVTGVVERRFDRQAWVQAVVCGLLTVPSVAYQWHMYRVDPAFHERVYDLTLSLPPLYYALGYGVAFILAVVAVCRLAARRFAGVESFVRDRRSLLLPVCWFAAAIALSYTPHVNFQRKMIMGAHVPLCLLAGVGFAICWEKMRLTSLRVAFAGICVALSIPTTLLFMGRDARHVLQNRSETLMSPFMTGDEASALRWIRANTAPDAAVLGNPTFTCFIPGWCDRYTYVSQWGESLDYRRKLSGYYRFIAANPDISARAAYLSMTKCDYLVSTNGLAGKPISSGMTSMGTYEDFSRFPSILTPVYANKELTIYRIDVAHAPK